MNVQYMLLVSQLAFVVCITKQSNGDVRQFWDETTQFPTIASHTYWSVIQRRKSTVKRVITAHVFQGLVTANQVENTGFTSFFFKVVLP